MATNEDKTVSIKLLIDTHRKRVIFAEADNDFVDILFSFLTLPLATIIGLLNKKSGIRSIDNLYESVENLDVKYMQTLACKSMLLHPRSAAASTYEDLKLDISDTRPREVYLCSSCNCEPDYNHPHLVDDLYYSMDRNAVCLKCGGKMDKVMSWPVGTSNGKGEASGNGVYVKSDGKFLISDDLQVTPSSLQGSIFLIQRMGIKDDSCFEENTMQLREPEVLNLLKRLLISKTPLTELWLQDTSSKKLKIEQDQILPRVKIESNLEDRSKYVSLKLFINKGNNKVVCAEAAEGMTDAIVSFLVLPLGSIVKLLNKNSGFGCADNLYKSVEALISLDYMKSEECSNMLLSPKLSAFYICSNNLLPMTEIPHGILGKVSCVYCWVNGQSCTCDLSDGWYRASLIQLNSKLAEGRTNTGRGYTKGKFFVSNGLHVSPFSIFDTIKCVGTESSFCNLVEKEVKLGESEVVNLLRAALISESPLSDVFSPNSK